ncbi:MAG TPA: hypothetical protein VM099_06125 [Gemmatimonadaceae bacterium]|nr:hypothetical protein [Gemmatimonadaceae bacterium]
MRRVSGFFVLLLMTVQAACYTSVPLESFPPKPGADVDVSLTTTGTEAMAAVLGPRVTGIQGRFLDVKSDSVFLSVSAVSLTNGDSNFWQHERVGVPRPYVGTVKLRKFSAGKSGAIAAAAVLGVTAITGLVVSSNRGGNKNPPPVTQ